jgi:hypothetical protein
MPEIDLETDQISRLLQCVEETEERLNTAHKAVIQHLGDIKNTLRGALTRASAADAWARSEALGHPQASAELPIPIDPIPPDPSIEADVNQLEASLRPPQARPGRR